MFTKTFKLSAPDGHRFKGSFWKSHVSEKVTPFGSVSIETINFDRTGSHDYSFCRISAETEKACYLQMMHEMCAGIYEYVRIGGITECDAD